MGNCCVNNQIYDENNTTYITYSDLIQDIDEVDQDILAAQDDMYSSNQDKNYSFKVKLSKFKGKMFSEDKWFISIDVDNDLQNIWIESGESMGKKDLRWSLEQTFFFKEKYKNFRKRYFTFKWKRNLRDTRPFAVLKIDLMTITTGPFLYSVRMNHMSHPNQCAGVISFKVEVEQLQKLTLSLSNMNAWFMTAEERALFVTFRIITYEDSINSEKSKSVVGDIVASQEYPLRYKWDTLAEESNYLSLELITSVESLKSSSLQLCFWKDKSFQKFDDIREWRYKRFLSSDTEDYAEVSRGTYNADYLHKQKWRSTHAKSLKSTRSFREKDDNRVTFKPKVAERASSTNRVSDDPLFGHVIHRSLKKKSAKKRGNLENLEGECYISFQRLLSNELRKMDKKDAQLFDKHMRQSTSNLDSTLSRNKADSLVKKKSDEVIDKEKAEVDSRKFSEQLWLYGMKIGKAKGIFKIKLGHSIHQMGVGLMTENGIKFNTSLILDNPKGAKVRDMGSMFIKSKDTGDLPGTFKELSKLKVELFRIEGSKNRRSLKGLQERERLLKLIIDNLQQNIGSKNVNVYENEFSLIRTQDLFLVLLLHCISVWDSVSHMNFIQYYYKIMKLIFKAYELELAQVGFKRDVETAEDADNLKEARDKAFAKFEINKKASSKGPVRTDAFIINSNELHQIVDHKSINLVEILHYQKILVALNYQFILWKTLKHSLKKLGKRGGISDDSLRDFIEKFIPIAYFRIPLFRKKFLAIINESIIEEDKNMSEIETGGENNESCKETTGDNSEPQFTNHRSSMNKAKKFKQNDEIEEWFRTEFPKNKDYLMVPLKTEPEEEEKNVDKAPDTDTESESDSQPEEVAEPNLPPSSPKVQLKTIKNYEGAITQIFDWDRYFYSHLPTDNEQQKESDRILKQTVNNNKWHDRMKKRGIGFLLIITEWAKYVKSAVVKRNVFWQDVPGYKIIVKAVLREMQKRSLLLYPDALIDWTMALLSNEKVSYW